MQLASRIKGMHGRKPEGVPVTSQAEAAGPGAVRKALRYEDINIPVSGPGEHFERYDALRAEASAHVATVHDRDRLVVVSGIDAIRSCLQDPATFSNRAVAVDDPNPSYLMIPEMIDPPLHTKWRHLLGPFFSPGAVERLTPRVHEVINEIIDDVIGRGQCDYVADVALRFPNTVFMEMFGLPVADAAQFQDWETAILHTPPSAGDDESPARRAAAMRDVMAYFSELVSQRRAQPRDDILSTALGFTIDGEPVSDQDLLSFCLLMFTAGLDTVAAQLSYSTYHLALHPDDRRRLAADPALWPSAIEEFLRYYAFVSPGRKATRDTEVGGCPVGAGQMVFLPLASANRDEAEFPEANQVKIDRQNNRHLAFGAGPHRCLGSHLARRELMIGLTVWHQRIPEYRLDPDVAITEHGRQVGLNNLPLVWDVPNADAR
jgi:cytochrome P450